MPGKRTERRERVDPPRILKGQPWKAKRVLLTTCAHSSCSGHADFSLGMVCTSQETQLPCGWTAAPFPRRGSLFWELTFELEPQETGNFPGGLVVKNLPANAGDADSVPGSGRSPGGGNGPPLQCSCLENPVDRGGWQAIVYRVDRSQTRLSDSARRPAPRRLRGTFLYLFFSILTIPELCSSNLLPATCVRKALEVLQDAWD